MRCVLNTFSDPEFSLRISVFIQATRVSISNIEYFPIVDEAKKQINVVVVLSTVPVKDSTFKHENSSRIAVVYLPWLKKTRKEVSDWISNNSHLADVWTGNFNTFQEKDRTETITQIMSCGQLEHCPSIESPSYSLQYEGIVNEKEKVMEMPYCQTSSGDSELVYLKFEPHVLNHTFYSKNYKGVIAVTHHPITWASIHPCIEILVK
jgi:hypothetical protein